MNELPCNLIKTRGIYDIPNMDINRPNENE